MCGLVKEQRQFFKVDDILAVSCVALGENRRTADYNTAGLMDQFLYGGKRFAGADNIVHDDNALALDQFGVFAV